MSAKQTKVTNLGYIKFKVLCPGYLMFDNLTHSQIVKNKNSAGSSDDKRLN